MVSFRFRAGLVLCILVVASGCGSAERSLSKGRALLDQGQYRDAEIQFRKALQKEPSNGEAFLGLGIARLRLKSWDGAYEALQNAVTLMPASEQANLELGNLLLPGFWNSTTRDEKTYESLQRISDRLIQINPKSWDGWRIRGYLALADKKPDQAIPSFRNCLSARPDDPDATAMLAQALTQSGDVAEGEKIAKDHIGRHPSDPLLYRVLVRSYLDHGRIADAEATMKLRIANNERDPRAVIELAEWYESNGKRIEAAALLNRLESSPAKFDDMYLLVGDYYARTARISQAMEMYRRGSGPDRARNLVLQKRMIRLLISDPDESEGVGPVIEQALREHPEDTEIRLVRCLLNLRSKDPQTRAAAIPQLEALVREQPENAVVRFHLGRALAIGGKTDEGRAELQKSAGLNPRFVPARLTLAALAIERQDFQEALRQADAILGIEPASMRGQIARVAALRGLGLTVDAWSHIRNLRRDFPGNPAVELEAAYLLLVEGKPQAAETILRALFRPGTGVRVVAGLAEALTAQRKNAEAVRVLQSDLAAAPDRPVVLFALAETLVRTGDAASAIQTYARLLASQPALPDAWLRLARLHASRAEGDQAAAVLRQAVTRFPDDDHMRQNLAEILLLSEKYEQAEQLFREWLTKQPSNVMLMNNVAFVLAERRTNLDEALALVQQAMARAPLDPGLQDTLGMVLLARGQKKQAAELFGKLVSRFPNRPSYRFHYGLSLLETGDRTGAKRQFSEALRADLPLLVQHRITRTMKAAGG
jgi:predicted Zn-dependent protease